MIEARILNFIEHLLYVNQSINLVSRKTTRDDLIFLVEESRLLLSHIHTKSIVDAGSGNGLLGIPLAIWLPDVTVTLVEPIHKKAKFLNDAKDKFQVENCHVFCGSLQEFKATTANSLLVARGFPSLEVLVQNVLTFHFAALLAITGKSKIEKIYDSLAKHKQKVYNMPSRDNLIIYQLESVSRETK